LDARCKGLGVIRAWGLGFRVVWGCLWFRVLGFRVYPSLLGSPAENTSAWAFSHSTFGVQGLGCGVHGVGLMT
jgi:hypothetical protein